MSRIYLIGAGPGRADLLTVRAARILARADIVLYDRLVSTEVLDIVPSAAERIHVGKEEGRQEEIQARILEQLEEGARKHETVVRLKGGDPMVFGRGAEEWLWLARRGWDVELVPGISSAIAVPALAGIPPTLRGVAGGFAVVTGNRKTGCCQEWEAYAKVDTLVILMGVERRAAIANCLLAAGRGSATPVAFIENGTTSRERVIVMSLKEVAEGGTEIHAPAVMVVGDVVNLRAELMPLLARAIA